jgi:hypothetical protein
LTPTARANTIQLALIAPTDAWGRRRGFSFCAEYALKPVLQALVLADRVYDDKASGKKIIAGTFSRIWFSKEVPKPADPANPGAPVTVNVPPAGMQTGSPYAYVSVTDVHHETKLTLRYVALKDAEPEVVFHTEIPIQCNDPLQTVEIVVPLLPLPTVKGVFALEVLYKNELLGSHRVVVEEVPSQTPPAPAP